MPRLMTLHAPADFAAWRHEARALLAAGVAPDDIVWRVDGSDFQAADLFALAFPTPAAPAATDNKLTVPRKFLDLCKDVICHSDDARFALLYRVLWRLARDKHLLQMATDIDVQRAQALAKAVRRDRHKMTAFVRFREVITANGSLWVAWFEPQHHIVESTAPFFVRRFAGMAWSILSPRRSAHWDGVDLSFGLGASRTDAPTEDALEEHWRTYFAGIFNPARLNTAAMQREMPKKYWKNMPETSLIPELVRAATQRADTMLANPPSPPRVMGQHRDAAMAIAHTSTPTVEQPPRSLRELTAQVDACRRCPLWRHATQAVPGEGPRAAAIMLVGEQPGDQEDLQGQPFVGPAGKLLDDALAAADLPRSALYVTNAVKHFKFEPRGKRRLHKKPNASEIEICRWWLASEIKLVQPKLIVALGATAAASLLQRPVKIGAERGRALSLPDGAQAFVTVHPSYLLRLPDAEVAEAERRRFIDDLKQVRRIAGELGVTLQAA